MTTRDGVRLDADVYRPASGGPYPVLLMRQAYDRRIGCTLCYAHPSWYAAHGYVVVVQDVRGRGTSEGFFRVGEHEIDDGADTVKWASELPGTTGSVGMYGFSYQGYNQFLAAVDGGPSLKALAPAMGPWSAPNHWAYENGAFLLQMNLAWATQVAADTAKHRGDAAAYAELMAASRALPLWERIQARPACIERHRDLSHYHKWLDTPAEHSYWQSISVASHAADLARKNTPTLLIGGWNDYHSAGTLAAFSDLTASGHTEVRLVMGPWLHFPWLRRIGELDFGPEAAISVDELQIRWFDRWLKEDEAGLGEEPRIRLFDVGANVWRDFKTWPKQRLILLLAAGGRATIDPADGRLAPESEMVIPGCDYLVHDPWRPAPAVGGALGNPPGPVDRAAVDSRGDVATFTSARLTSPLSLAGDVSAELYVTCDSASFDIGCVLSRVTSNNQVFQVAAGYRTVKNHAADKPVVVSMHATCVTLKAGEALRLSLSGAAFPAFPVNPGTGVDPTRASAAEAKVINIGMRYGPGQQSRLVVAVAE